MPFLAAGALAVLAKGALTTVIGPFIEEARDVALNAAQDSIRSTVAGKMSIDEWANIVIDGVDSVKERAISEGNLRFIGGKLKFSTAAYNVEMISISFQLYFQDEFNKWQKAEASSDIPASKFSLEALNELNAKGEITFDVE